VHLPLDREQYTDFIEKMISREPQLV